MYVKCKNKQSKQHSFIIQRCKTVLEWMRETSEWEKRKICTPSPHFMALNKLITITSNLLSQELSCRVTLDIFKLQNKKIIIIIIRDAKG